jgi:enoyl-CoA hydratase/carnithine racemase
MMINALDVHILEDIGTITLNRPGKHNAITQAMWRALPTAIEHLIHAPRVRLIILRGAQPDFAAGADIAEFDSVYADRASAAAYAALIEASMAAITACPKPVLAAVSGLCIGAGVALTLATDLCFADETASFAITPAKLGIAYSFSDTRRLVTRVGAANARDLLFTARRIDAAEALSMGLIHRLCSPAALDQDIGAYATRIVTASPASIAVAKSFVARATGGLVTEDETTRAAYLDILQGPDFAEGLAAFKAKRRPNFQNTP